MQNQSKSALLELSAATKRAIIYIALTQGILLLGIHELIDRTWWPATSMPLRTLWYTLALTVPTALYLLVRDVRDRRLWIMLAAYAALLVPMALYTGAQYDPSHHTEGWTLFIPYAFSQAAIWFVVTFFMNLRLDGESVWTSRQDVCAYTWRHGLALGLLGVFIGVLWMLLFLWGALFKVINISFFQDLFENRRFIYPVFGLAGGFAVVVLRGQFDAVGLLERIASALLRVLLPVLALIVLLFLGALLFTGVHALWKAGLGTALMMWLLCLMLLFVNVAFHGSQSRYPIWLRWPILLALVLSPIYLGLCAWAMWLRVAEHGWSLERLLAAMLLLVISSFVLSYALVVVSKREAWLDWLPRINKSVGAAAAVLLVLTCLPVLNLQGIAARDQVDRLLAGKVSPADFDYAYLRFRLGEAGYQQLLALQKSAFMAQRPAELAKLDATLKAQNFWTPGKAVVPAAPTELAKALPGYPQGELVPPELLTAIAADQQNSHCFVTGVHCEIVGMDLRGDQGREYLVFAPDGWYGKLPIYAQLAGKWQEIANLDSLGRNEARAMQHALETGAYRLEKPAYPDLVVGQTRVQIHAK